MLDNTLTDDFIKTLNTIATHKHRFDVFKDFIIFSALSLHNAVSFNQELEDEYLALAKSHTKEDMDSFAKLFAILVNILEAKPFDALGQIYMKLGFGDVRKGQFFTPPHICELMSDLVYTDKIQRSCCDDIITLSEPACGGGGMILAFADSLIKDGYNPATKLWVEAIDIDRTSALMCYIQLSLWNIPARVITGNSLSLEVHESLYTPAHYLNFWDAKLKKKSDNAKEVKTDDSNDDNSGSEVVDEEIKSNNAQNDVIYPATPKKGIASGQLSLF